MSNSRISFAMRMLMTLFAWPGCSLFLNDEMPVDAVRTHCGVIGAIINMSSGTVASKGRAGQAAYCASKAALERLSESIAEDVKEYGIAVNILSPW